MQRDWLCLGKDPVTIHDTKRWGTAQIRLAESAPDKHFDVEIIGRGKLSFLPASENAAESSPHDLRSKTTQTVELPRLADASRLVKYSLEGLLTDESLDLYLAFRVESLGRVWVVGPEANGKTVTVKDVDVVMIRLPGEDPNTAAWSMASVRGNAVEALGGVEYEGDTANVFKIALNGTFKTLLRVRQKGRATVRMQYRPCDPKDRTKPQSFQVRLNVQSGPAQTPASN